MKNENKKNGYAYSKRWFDFMLESKEMVRPIHTALYFWIVEMNNRQQWKEVFGLPTEYSMKAIGIKGRLHYKNALDDLIKWGFVNLVSKSKNQHMSNQISLCLPVTLSNKQDNLPVTLSNNCLQRKVTSKRTKGYKQADLPVTLSYTYKTEEQTILNYFKSEKTNSLFIDFLKNEEKNGRSLSEERIKSLIQNLKDVAETEGEMNASINQAIAGNYSSFRVVKDRKIGIQEQIEERERRR